MRWTMSRAGLLAAALWGLASAACDSVTGSESSITLSLSSTEATVAQGGNTTVALNVARSNFSKAVNLAVDGLPAGVTAAFTPSFLTGNEEGSTLLIAATGGAAPGMVTLTVRASGEGITEQTATIALTVGTTGAFTLAPYLPTVTVAQGGGGSALILIDRTGGNAAAVSLAVTGAPSGVSVSLNAPSTTERGASLSLTAESGAVPGTYPLTITGTSSGFDEQSTTVSVAVIAPPATAAMSIPFCSEDGPDWFAYQNEGYGWQRVLPAAGGSVFTFQATERLAIAFVFQDSEGTTTNAYYATRPEVAGNTDLECAGPNSVSGTVNGLSTGQSVRVQMGGDDAVLEAGGANSYTLTAVPDRTLDLVATIGMAPDVFTAERMIIRRALDQANNSTIPPLDVSTESFALDSTNFALVGVQSGEELYFQNFLWTATTTFGLIQTSEPPGAGSSKLYFVPSPQLATGDLHEVYVDARMVTSTSLVGHSYIAYSAAPANRSDALGAHLTSPTVSMVSSSPHVRMRGRVPSQAEYGSSVRFAFQQGGGFRTTIFGVTAGYLGGVPATWDAVVPDFTGAEGFDPSWMLEPQTSTIYQVEAFSGRPDLLFGAHPTDGDLIRFAYRVGFTGTALRSLASFSPVPSRLPARRLGERARPQYFKR